MDGSRVSQGLWLVVRSLLIGAPAIVLLCQIGWLLQVLLSWPSLTDILGTPVSEIVTIANAGLTTALLFMMAFALRLGRWAGNVYGRRRGGNRCRTAPYTPLPGQLRLRARPMLPTSSGDGGGCSDKY